ncbi:hypothetical protein V6N13_026487 [Hibiscus sabdariffa]|uniref:Uncharacterized protein n=1 Tax=Hibiscus sabdariffa TaxID=183260 RepID=A0ABR2AU47_9ROSI
MITSSVESCLTFKQTPTSKLQYGNWIRYVPPRKQEANPRAKGIIRYLHGKGRSNPKTSGNEKPLNIANPSAETPVPNLVVDADSTNAPTKPVDIITTAPFTHVMLDITAPKMVTETIMNYTSIDLSKSLGTASFVAPLTATADPWWGI